MALCGGFRPRCPSARLSEGSISRSLPISCSCWDNGTLPPALSPFPVFSVFSGRCARHVPAGQKGGSFSLFQRLLSWQARAPSPLPRPLLWDLPDHCLLTVPSSPANGLLFPSPKQQTQSSPSAVLPLRFRPFTPVSQGSPGGCLPSPPQPLPPHSFLALRSRGSWERQLRLGPVGSCGPSPWCVAPTLGSASRAGPP